MLPPKATRRAAAYQTVVITPAGAGAVAAPCARLDHGLLHVANLRHLDSLYLGNLCRELFRLVLTAAHQAHQILQCFRASRWRNQPGFVHFLPNSED